MLAGASLTTGADNRQRLQAVFLHHRIPTNATMKLYTNVVLARAGSRVARPNMYDIITEAQKLTKASLVERTVPNPLPESNENAQKKRCQAGVCVVSPDNGKSLW